MNVSVEIYHVTKQNEANFSQNSLESIKKNDNCIAIVSRENGTQKPNIGQWQIPGDMVNIILNQNKGGFKPPLVERTENITSVLSCKNNTEILFLIADGTNAKANEILDQTNKLIQSAQRRSLSNKTLPIVLNILANKKDTNGDNGHHSDFLPYQDFTYLSRILLPEERGLHLHLNHSESATESMMEHHKEEGSPLLYSCTITVDQGNSINLVPTQSDSVKDSAKDPGKQEGNVGHVVPKPVITKIIPISKSFPNKKKPKIAKWKKIALLALLIIAIAAAAVGAYFGLKNK